MNTSYLSTLFKKEVGMTLTDYVNTNRIEYAKKLLRSTLLPVQDVAAACGIPGRPLFHTALPPHHGHDATRVETLKDRGMECGRHGFCKYTVSACSGLPTGGGNPLKQNGSISSMPRLVSDSVSFHVLTIRERCPTTADNGRTF